MSLLLCRMKQTAKTRKSSAAEKIAQKQAAKKAKRMFLSGKADVASSQTPQKASKVDAEDSSPDVRQLFQEVQTFGDFLLPEQMTVKTAKGIVCSESSHTLR